MSERRLENRFLCAELVTVDWIEAEAGFGVAPRAAPRVVPSDAAPSEAARRTVEAVLEDISALGACVQVEDRIPLGAAISISAHHGGEDARSARFSGYVSYCEYRDFGYFVGIRLSDETPWSAREFKPEHLTNLAAMLRPVGARSKKRAPLVLAPTVH
jgi:hypothetical protein